jgi:hypothetical protein
MICKKGSAFTDKNNNKYIFNVDVEMEINNGLVEKILDTSGKVLYENIGELCKFDSTITIN